ncbi:MAG: hypothetical protein AAB482_01310 [Patescibacteria group bacterium]
MAEKGLYTPTAGKILLLAVAVIIGLRISDTIVDRSFEARINVVKEVLVEKDKSHQDLTRLCDGHLTAIQISPEGSAKQIYEFVRCSLVVDESVPESPVKMLSVSLFGEDAQSAAFSISKTYVLPSSW